MPLGSGDRWPEDYERGRPGWPPEVVELTALARTATVLDLGAGTGKLTRLLAATFDRVVAVEPAEPMRLLLEELCPTAKALRGTGQDIPLPDASVDAVFAGQSFHWFDDEDAVAEIVRVLRPRGTLVLLWNVPAGPWEPSTAPVEELLSEVGPDPGDVSYDPLDLGGPRYEPGAWPLPDATFEPLAERRIPNPQTLDHEGLVSYYASMGWLADLPDRERLPLIEKVRSLLPATEYRRRWETLAYRARLASGDATS